MSAPTSPSGRAARFLAVVATLALAAASCSIQPDEVATPIDDVPPELFSTTTTTTIPIEEEPTEFFVPLVFITDDDANRILIERPAETPPSVQDVLDALNGQPLEEELVQYSVGFSSRLLPGLEPQAEPIDDGRLRVIVQGAELRLTRDENPDRVRFIYSQIVCSVTALPGLGIDTVAIHDAEGLISPLIEGETTTVERGVGRADYNECLSAEEELAIDPEGDEGEDGEGDEGSDTTTNDG